MKPGMFRSWADLLKTMLAAWLCFVVAFSVIYAIIHWVVWFCSMVLGW